MLIYPAIDIKGGRVARMVEHERGREASSGDDPVAQAQAFMADGAEWLHVVDLDRALDTGRDNTQWVHRIAALAPARVQVGGNIRTLSWAKAVITAGAARVILGTEVALDEGLFDRLVQEIGPQHCGFAVEVRDGRVVLRTGPVRRPPTVANLVERALNRGVRTIVYRDISRDGQMQGADIAGAAAVAALGASVIVAGGIAGLGDVRAAAAAGLRGVIVGRALYEGQFTLSEALECSR